MGVSRTRNDLVYEALANIGVLQAGQTPAPEDFNFIDEKLQSIIDGLHAREIVFVADLNDIPNEWFDPLASIVADACKAKFGIDGDSLQVLMADRQKAEIDLKVMTRGKPTFEPQRTLFL